MSRTHYFRAGVGAVIYDQHGHIALFQRRKHPVGIWQFCQGGIELTDSIEATLWKELLEETGLTKHDIVARHELPHWTVYEDPTPVYEAERARLGQVHRWFFLALSPTTTIDLARATDQEFSAHQWCTWEDAIAGTSPHKRHVYEQLHDYFAITIAPTLPPQS